MASPMLSMEQIIQVYEESGRSVDSAVLQNTADKLFPDSGVKFHSYTGGARGYRDAEDNLLFHKHTIGTGPNCVSIMEDGSAKPY